MATSIADCDHQRETRFDPSAVSVIGAAGPAGEPVSGELAEAAGWAPPVAEAWPLSWWIDEVAECAAALLAGSGGGPIFFAGRCDLVHDTAPLRWPRPRSAASRDWADYEFAADASHDARARDRRAESQIAAAIGRRPYDGKVLLLRALTARPASGEPWLAALVAQLRQQCRHPWVVSPR